MKPPKRQVRTISVPSITDKRFKKVGESSRTIDPDRMSVHPLLVIADLQKGCLKTLHRYLTQESGIPDAGVARALQKLISGNPEDTHFQLAVTEHPDRPNAKGGRPTKTKSTPTQKQLETVYLLEQLQLDNVPTEAAVAEVAEKRGIGKSTVYSHLQSVKAYRKWNEADEARLEQNRVRRERMTARRHMALESLRTNAKTKID